MDLPGTAPLSFAQQRLWFLEQLAPGGTAYTMPWALRLTGPLDEAALRQALVDLVVRHEAMRTAYVLVGETPRQIVRPAEAVELPVVDLTTAADQASAVSQHAAGELARPFDLESGQMFRARLLRLAAREHVLLLAQHHLSSDGWSRRIMLRELGALYAARVEGTPAPLPALPLQYVDFARRQHEWARSADFDRQRAYWHATLAGLQSVELPADRPRPAVPSTQAGRVEIAMTPDEVERARALGRTAGASTFMTLLAAFKAVIARQTGQDDVAIGIPIANRTSVEVEPIIGMFVNTLVLRTDLSGPPTFRELVDRVRRVSLGAFAHQEFPFEQLVADLHPAREAGRTPWIQVLVNKVEIIGDEVPFGPLRAVHEDCFADQARFDLTLYVWPYGPDAGVRLAYASDRFDHDHAAEILNQFGAFLRSATRDPDRRITEHSLVTARSRRVLPDPAAALAAPPIDDPEPTVLLDHAERRGDCEAIRWRGRSWSYRDLSQAVRGVAAALIARGVRRGDVVALEGQRSFGLVASLVGIMAGGGVALPLDGRLPAARRDLMIREGRARWMVTVRESDAPDAPPIGDDFVPIEVDPWTGLPHQTAAGSPDGLPILHPDDCAYIFFTSGSSGVPKGILGTHAGISHFIRWQRETFQIGAEDRVAQLASWSFDVLLRDLFLPLSAGAVSCLPDTDEAAWSPDVLEWFARERVSVLHAVPSVVRRWLEGEADGTQQPLPDLRWTFFAGEPLPASLVARWRARAPNAGVVNLYGPTETCMVKCAYAVPATPRDGVQPIGEPVPGSQALIVTASGLLGGIGEPGEIVIRTVHGTKGYLETVAQQDRERFRVNPFRLDPADIVYATGDLGRVRHDGALEILGRLDNQVKVNGVRIEPGEIEAALETHEAVRASAVVAVPDADGQPSLVAYLVAPGAEADTLRAHLTARVPAAMLPRAWVFLPALPLTPTGKVNRAALPAPDNSRAAGPPFVAPRDPNERALAAIWSEVLRVERVGVHDNFFDLGGHSLIAAQVAVRAARTLGWQLPVRAIFDSPTVAALARQYGAPGESTGAGGSEPDRADESHPLSFAQQRVWFIDQLNPGRAAYNITRAFAIGGPLDIDALRAALTGLVRRHATLRTTVSEVDGEPRQVVHPPAPVGLPVSDLETVSDPEAESASAIGAEVSKPFDLRRDPMLRAVLIRRAPERHVLLITVHHIAVDGWSLGLLERDLGSLYAAARDASPAPEPRDLVPYTDFARWQREQSQGPSFDRHRSYWRERLRSLPRTELLSDRPRKPEPPSLESRVSFTVPSSVCDRLRTLARSEQATPFMVLLAAFQALLSRWCGQEDVAVAVPVASRPKREFESIVGFMVNTVVMRTDLSNDPTCGQLAARVRETVLGAFEHQDVPFEQLVADLQPERDLSRNPFVQILFALQNASTSSLALAGLDVQPIPVTRRRTGFDLECHLVPQGGGLDGSVSFSEALFERTTVERLAAQFVTLLEAWSLRPDLRVSQVPLLSDAERAVVLAGWNATAADYPREQCLHDLVTAQATRTPEAIAIEAADEHVTYRELLDRASRLADVLRGLGVGLDVPVGLSMERNANLVVGILGILMAGGAYVPLDPDHPPTRLSLSLDIAQVTVIVTERSLAGALRATGRPLLCLDEPLQPPDEVTTRRTPSATSRHLAYVMFTSGSTGEPKGVGVEHRSVVNLIWDVRSRLEASERDTILSSANYAFDVSVADYFLALITGARLVLVSRETARDGSALMAALSRTRPTVFQATPSMWRVLCTLGWRPEGPMTAISTGEALPDDLAWDLAARCPVVWNLYGPTETTIWSTGLRVGADGSNGSIGRPLANTVAYVLDDAGQPAPAGVPGELFIGGDGVARGYLNRPELTAERFVPSPFEPGMRLYRTGDRARWRAGGELQFLGRRDGQVKIRGHRIETQEIEAVMGRHPAVRAAIVMADRDGAGDARLVAYYVPADGATIDARALAAHLRGALPGYMVPAQLVALPALPITPNGKIDRIALRALRPDVQPDAAEVREPETKVERALAGIWTELLGVGHVGLDDHFFDLGGHSLLATRMMVRVRDAFGVELPLRAVFEAPTLDGLAGRIARVLPESPPAPGAPAAERAVPAPLAPGEPARLSFPQKRLWFLQQLDPASTAYHIVRVLDLEGPLDRRALEAAFAAIVARHHVLRASVTAESGEPLQALDGSRSFALESVDLRAPDAAGPAEVARRVEAERARPFDLRADTLLRALLLQIADDRHRLVITLHHIAADAWSLDVLAGELAELYAAGVERRAPRLPDLPLQYADFARWQLDRTRGAALDRALDFWCGALRHVPVLELPADHARPAQMSHAGADRRFTIPAGLARRLRELSRTEGATLFMTLLAAFDVLLARRSGQHDFAVGVPMMNRPRPEFERLIGFFANTLVLRADLSGDPTFRELVARVRRTTLDAFDYQDLPFERLVAELAPARDLGRTPLVQVVFSLVAAGEPVRLTGLTVSQPYSPSDRARFDLELLIQENVDGSLAGAFVYAADLFADSTVGRMTAEFITLLESVAADADARVSRASLLPVGERDLLLSAGFDTAAAYPREASLGTLFDEVSARSPDAVAVVAAGGTTTYGELRARADALAHRLRQLGVGRDVPVGLCVNRGVNLVAGMLGIVKAGGAYLPLDPTGPPARTQLMMEDAQAAVVVTETACRDGLAGTKATLVDLDADVIALPDSPAALLAVPADSLAYVMYTSGSTGRPKGVMVPHRAVTRLVLGTNYVQLGPADTVAQVSNAAFDAATFEVWGALLNGARLVVLDRETIVGPDLEAALRRHRVSAIFLTAALFSHVARHAPAALAPVANVLVGGDSMEAEAVRRVQSAGVPARLLNCYGPTESTTFAVWHEVGPIGETDASVPIGRPIANTTACVLDEALQLVPIGVPGELCLGGDGLARGYLGSPELTAERFVPHPLANGGRLYRTGDRARWREDGCIEFLGRRDGQIKLRGHRIELGEIEAALAGLPAVAACVASAMDTPSGDRRLVAHVVPRPGHNPQAGPLLQALRQRLPDYMVPAAIVFVGDLPLTANGKVDRRALPAPFAERPATGDRPLSDTEARLARLWRDVLQIPAIGPDDGFFELGGHSLLAVQLFSRIEQEFGVFLPLSHLFVHGTIARLARVLDDTRHVEPWTPLVPIRPTGSGRPLFLIHGIGGEVLSFTHLALRLPADVPVYGIQAAGPGSSGTEPAQIDALAARYVDIVTSVDKTGPYYLGGYSSGAVVALEIARQLEAQGRSVALVLALDGGLPDGAVAVPRARHSPVSLLRQFGYWVVDDALATSAQEWWPRARSVVRRVTGQIGLRGVLGSANGRRPGDVRDDLGMWRFPDSYSGLLQARYDAFRRHRPRPVLGHVALVRSRTGRLFGPPPRNLDDAWRALAKGSFTVRYVRGSHANILMEPRVTELARTVGDLLHGSRNAKLPPIAGSP